jgi:hypothetical protein
MINVDSWPGFRHATLRFGSSDPETQSEKNMKSPIRRFAIFPVALLAFLAGAMPASATLRTLTSPDNRWSLSSDEFGAHGEGVGGSFAQRDFGNGAGLTGYSWGSTALLIDGATRQWLGSDAGFGVVNTPVMGAGNVVSDVPLGNQRISVFNVPGFANIQVSLTQTVANSGITQQYVITNNRATQANLTFMQFHDVDLDGATYLNDIVTSDGQSLSVSEGGRAVYFSPSPIGYAGFLAGHVGGGGGITGNLNLFGFNNSGIPVANLNQFREFPTNSPVPGANRDANGDGRSDSPFDVGYLFHNNLNIPAGGSVSLTLTQGQIPEPAAGLLTCLALGLTFRRRR